MGFYEYLNEFAGLPVVAFPIAPDRDLPDVEGPVAWRLDCWTCFEEEVDFGELFADFLQRVDTTKLTALVIGMWDSESAMDADYPVADLLAEHAGRFPALRALFLGDIFEGGDGGSDIAYIEHGDLTPILRSFPELEELWVRGGGSGGYFEPLAHISLRTLVFQSGGLAAEGVRELGDCDLPNLEHLEIYFGHPRYGGDGTPEDVAWLLAGGRVPRLRYLGLRDSMIQDEIAAAVAHAPVVAQLETLDLSLGALGDEGAAALLAGQPLHHLRKLDLHHHYMSAPMQERLRQAWPGIEIDLSGLEVEDEFGRYIAVAE